MAVDMPDRPQPSHEPATAGERIKNLCRSELHAFEQALDKALGHTAAKDADRKAYALVSDVNTFLGKPENGMRPDKKHDLSQIVIATQKIQDPAQRELIEKTARYYVFTQDYIPPDLLPDKTPEVRYESHSLVQEILLESLRDVVKARQEKEARERKKHGDNVVDAINLKNRLIDSLKQHLRQRGR